MTDVRHTDYAWIRDDPRLFDEGFCLTIFTAISVDDVLASLPSVVTAKRGDYDALAELAYDRGFDMVGGLLQVEDSVVLYEPYGHFEDSIKQSLSIGRVVVSIDGNPAVSYFQFFRNGANVTTFEKMFAYDRRGDEPDVLLSLMQQIGGFDLDPDSDDEVAGLSTLTPSLALSEAVTGLRLTYSLLTRSQYAICHFARNQQ